MWTNVKLVTTVPVLQHAVTMREAMSVRAHQDTPNPDNMDAQV